MSRLFAANVARRVLRVIRAGRIVRGVAIGGSSPC